MRPPNILRWMVAQTAHREARRGGGDPVTHAVEGERKLVRKHSWVQREGENLKKMKS